MSWPWSLGSDYEHSGREVMDYSCVITDSYCTLLNHPYGPLWPITTEIAIVIVRFELCHTGYALINNDEW